jgi:hypothetical protein
MRIIHLLHRTRLSHRFSRWPAMSPPRRREKKIFYISLKAYNSIQFFFLRNERIDEKRVE